jgi:hypothetical protein
MFFPKARHKHTAQSECDRSARDKRRAIGSALNSEAANQYLTEQP